MARFDVETTNAMAIAFDHACKALGGPPEIIRDVVARHIFETAEAGEREPEKLSAQVLQALEGYRKVTDGERA